MTELEEKVLNEIKKHTVDDPIYSPTLEFKADAPASEVRRAIRSLRRQGKPIVNTVIIDGKPCKAYAWARNSQELLPTLEDLKARCKSMYVTIAKMQKNCFKDAQGSLSFMDELKQLDKETVN